MNSPDWNILYRGSLSSCNYACDYCPFAKTRNTRAELAVDKQELLRFCDWVERRDERIGLLFTPWGEALVRSHYRQAMVALSHMSNVSRVAIQTNMSCSTAWIKKANLDAIAFWVTYHPGETSEDAFIEKCLSLSDIGARHSVGVVGLKAHFDSIARLRERLPDDIYLWVNAFKRDPDYYQAEDLKFITSIDPYFKHNCQYHPSIGSQCHAGHSSFTVDGDGNAQRCHFISGTIGNIYEDGFTDKLSPTNCSAAQCGCHIGYVHLQKLKLGALYREGLLERVPDQWPVVDARFTG